MIHNVVWHESDQEHYEAIREWFSKPGAVLGWDQAASECVYSGSRGQRCAVGCLFNDVETEQYGNFKGSLKKLLYYANQDRYNNPAASSLSRFAPGVAFLIECQYIHDDLASMSGKAEDFVGDLDVLAAEWGLKVREEES